MQTCFQNEGMTISISAKDQSLHPIQFDVKCNHSVHPTPKPALYEDSNARIEFYKHALVSTLKRGKQNWN
jgi:hypothetical protein